MARDVKLALPMRHHLAWLLVLVPVACGGSTAGVDLQGADDDAGLVDASRDDAGAVRDGSGGDGGGSSDAGGGACTGPGAIFTMIPKGAFCMGHNCNGAWLTILAPDGATLDTGSSFMCGTDCATCISQPCPPGPCAVPSPVPPAGVTTTWNGRYFTNETRTCKGASVSCLQARCAAPGRYTARMCGFARLDDGGLSCNESNTATCTDVPFDWPNAASVTGTIGP